MVLQKNLRHSTMTPPPHQFYPPLSLTLEAPVLRCYPWDGSKARQSHNVGLSAWKMFLCIISRAKVKEAAATHSDTCTHFHSDSYTHQTVILARKPCHTGILTHDGLYTEIWIAAFTEVDSKKKAPLKLIHCSQPLAQRSNSSLSPGHMFTQRRKS